MALLKKWKSETSRVAVLFDGREVRSSVVGLVLSASEEEVCIGLSGGPVSTKIRFPLTEAESFEYTEPREAAEVDRERLASKLACGLEISFKSGDRCFLYELVE